MSDPLIRLSALPSAAPNPARAERVRTRCRTRLMRQAPRPAPERSRHVVRVWQPVIVLLAIGYVAEVVVEALRVYGLR
ncbi:MAG: hypothetical protein AB7H93_06470 [Vicinamibacterales bacterium]